MDNCPNCGTPEDRGIKDELPKGLIGLTMNATAITSSVFIFIVVISVLVYFASKSVLIAALSFLGMLCLVAATLFFWTEMG